MRMIVCDLEFRGGLDDFLRCFNLSFTISNQKKKSASRIPFEFYCKQIIREYIYKKLSFGEIIFMKLLPNIRK